MRLDLSRLQELLNRPAIPASRPRQVMPRGFCPQQRPTGLVYLHRESIPLRDEEHLAPILTLQLANLAHMVTPLPATLEDLVFLDTETTGLGGSGVYSFLIGLGRLQGEHLELVQLLLPSPAHELALLQSLSELWTPASVLVTYNGKAFDWPLLMDRFIINAKEVPRWAFHLDLLFWARRMFSGSVSNCRLSNVQAQVLGQMRTDGIGGAEVPAAYFDYLQTGSAGELNRVVERNRDDVIALVTLTTELTAYWAGHLPQRRAGRVLMGLARTCEERGDVEVALRYYEEAIKQHLGQRERFEAMKRAAFLCKRNGDGDSARRWFERAEETWPGDPEPLVELAKYCEHQDKDWASARRWVVRALDTLPATAIARWREPLCHRLARLDRKLDRAGGGYARGR